MASYPLPSWLQPRGNPGEEYISAFHAGSAVAMEQQRLQAEQARSAMAAAEKAQIAQQDALQQQQRIEIEKQISQQKIGLQKQELDQAQQKITQAAHSAAQRFAAQESIKRKIAGGMSLDQAFLSEPGAFTSMAGAAALSKQLHERFNPTPPKDITPKLFTGPDGRVHLYNPQTGAEFGKGAEDKGPTVSVPLTDNPFGPKISGRLNDPNVRKALGTNAPAITGEQPQGQVPPLPKKKDDLVKGQKYQTSRGVLTWDGEKLVKE